jgi:glutathione synthase/RimK-type ligase-like ATP-grasp enzyme
MTADIAVYYEHPRWFEHLWAALDRRGVPHRRLEAAGHSFGLGDPAPAPVIFNRMAMSAPQRSGAEGHPLFYTAALLDHWERAGARVVNGSKPFSYDLSKARQLGLFRSLGLPTPETRVVHRAQDAPAAAAGLRFPVLVKVNIGGSGRGIEKFETPEALAEAAREGRLDLGVDGVALVQEAAPKRGDTITRLETLGGRFLYAIDVRVETETFDLCPADVCLVGSPVVITRADPSPELIAGAERVAQAAGLDVGGVEMLVDDRDGTLRFFDFNGMSNFVAGAPELLGFDPHERLVDFLLAQLPARKAA